MARWFQQFDDGSTYEMRGQVFGTGAHKFGIWEAGRHFQVDHVATGAKLYGLFDTSAHASLFARLCAAAEEIDFSQLASPKCDPCMRNEYARLLRGILNRVAGGKYRLKQRQQGI